MDSGHGRSDENPRGHLCPGQRVMVKWVHDGLQYFRAHPDIFMRNDLRDVVAHATRTGRDTVARIVAAAHASTDDASTGSADEAAANQEPTQQAIPALEELMPVVRAFVHGKNTLKPRQPVHVADVCAHLRAVLGVEVGQKRMARGMRRAGFAFGPVTTKPTRYIEGESHAVVEKRAHYLKRMLALRGDDGMPLRPLITVDESYCRVRPGGAWTWFDKLGHERYVSAQEDGPLAVLIGAGVFFSQYGRLQGTWVEQSVHVWNAATKPKWGSVLHAGSDASDASAADAADGAAQRAGGIAAGEGAAALERGSAEEMLGCAPELFVLPSGSPTVQMECSEDGSMTDDSGSSGAATEAGGGGDEASAPEYGGHMNAALFEAWFARMCASARARHGSCTIIMDNAAYHARRIDPAPTARWRKKELLSYCSRHGIDTPPGATVKQLLQLAKSAAVPPRFAAVEIAREHGHELLYLPAYHPELNPVEAIWMVVKQHLRLHPPSTMSQLIEKARAALYERATLAAWRHAYARTVAWEEKYVSDQNLRE